MTTMAMIFGMLPLSLGLAEGAEFRRSMGTVLIGGSDQLADPDAVSRPGHLYVGRRLHRRPRAATCRFHGT